MEAKRLGRDTPLTYNLKPLVSGISFSEEDRLVSGTPSEAGKFNMTYTVRDREGREDTRSFTITVKPAGPIFKEMIGDVSYTIGDPITPWTLPEATCGDHPLAYSLPPDTPGISFSEEDRLVSGTPSETGTFDMTYTVRDREGRKASLNFTITVEPRPAKLYWTDARAHKIQRANLDGTEVEDLLDSGLDSPSGIVALAGKLYWTEVGTIRRANLNGTEVEDLVTSGLRTPVGIAVFAGKLYWTDARTAKIYRANLDGTEIEGVVTSGLESPGGIAVHAGKLYWTESGTGKIQRANLNGSDVQDLVTGLDSPRGIAIDGDKMYWTESGTDKIQRADLDGSQVEDLVTGLDFPVGITIHAGKMYWTDARTDKIQRANLDDMEVEDLVGSLTHPAGIAVR